MDSDSGNPISGAQVARIAGLHNVERVDETATDPMGHFRFAGATELRWFYLDRPAAVEYKIESVGHVSTEVHGSGWAFDKNLRHDIGDIRLQPK